MVKPPAALVAKNVSALCDALAECVERDEDKKCRDLIRATFLSLLEAGMSEAECRDWRVSCAHCARGDANGCCVGQVGGLRKGGRVP